MIYRGITYKLCYESADRFKYGALYTWHELTQQWIFDSSLWKSQIPDNSEASLKKYAEQSIDGSYNVGIYR